MQCKICNSEAKKIFNSKVLYKYNVDYFQCINCKFIQTEKPFWLNEAYENPIGKVDIGLVSRNIFYSKIVRNLISKFFDSDASFLDYGGGYGMFVRILRDNGFNYFRQDDYCDNLFANHFDITDSDVTKFELLTAFELFEHLENPCMELENMLSFSGNIFFSTLLQPKENPTPSNWWYFMPSAGQHIALYSYNALNILACKYGLNYYNNGTFHLFTRKKINKSLYQFFTDSRYAGIINRFYERTSFLDIDFEKIQKLHK